MSHAPSGHSHHNPFFYLFGQAFAKGFGFALLFNSGYALILSSFGSAGLRMLYLTVGVAGTLFTLLLAWIEEHYVLSRVNTGFTAFFAFVALVIFLLLRLQESAIVELALMVLTTVGMLVTLMLRGSQVGILYDPRKIKVVYPRVSGGEVLAVVIVGLSFSVLVDFFGGLVNLILVGAVALGFAAIIARTIAVLFLKPHEAMEALTEHHEHHEHGLKPILRILKKRYTLLVFAFQLASFATTLLIQYVVYSLAGNFFTDSVALGQFIALTKAGSSGFSFIFLIGLAGRLLMRFGLALGVGGGPMTAFILIVSAFLAALAGPEAALLLFIIMVTAQIVDYALYSGLAKTAMQIMFQPLPHHEEHMVHLFSQGVGLTISYGFAGLILVLVRQLPGNPGINALVITFVMVIVAGVSGFQLTKRYREIILKAVSRIRFSPEELDISNPEVRASLDEYLESNDAWQIKTAVDLLEKGDEHDYMETVKGLLGHTNPEVRIDSLRRIEAKLPVWGESLLLDYLKQEEDEKVKGYAIRTLCAVSPQPVQYAGEYLQSSSRELLTAAVTGLFLHGGIDGVIKAGERFNALMESSEIEDRAMAAHILADAGIPNFFMPLQQLLRDKETEVVLSALIAAEQAPHPSLLPAILDLIEPLETRVVALKTLQAFGIAYQELLVQVIEGSDHLSERQRFRIIDSCWNAPGHEVTELLYSHIEVKNPIMQERVILALSRRNILATGARIPQIERMISEFSLEAARARLAADEVAEYDDLLSLNSALIDYYTRKVEVVLRLLSLVFDPELIWGIRWRVMVGSSHEKGLAIEGLDVVLEKEMRAQVLSVGEPPETAAARRERFKKVFGLSTMSAQDRIREILTRDDLWHETWLKSIAYHAALTLNMESGSEDQTMVETIERVLTLKRAEIFHAIPDYILAHLSSVGEYVHYEDGEVLINEGEYGNSLYVIDKGKVAIEVGGNRLVVLDEGQVVGEMAVLDPEARSATVRAVGPVVAMRMGKEGFDSMMADYPTIAAGVIAVLCRRLRKFQSNK